MTTAEALAPSPNVEAFVATLAYIEAHPEEHNQDSWVCETTMCFAGHAAITVGGLQQVGPSTWVRGLNGRECHVADAACEVLGLSTGRRNDDQPASRLFYGAESLDDLYRISADILGLAESTLREKVAAVVADGATQVGSA